MEKNHIFMGNKNPLKLTLNERQLWVHTKIIVHLSVSVSAPTKQYLNIYIIIVKSVAHEAFETE